MNNIIIFNNLPLELSFLIHSFVCGQIKRENKILNFQKQYLLTMPSLSVISPVNITINCTEIVNDIFKEDIERYWKSKKPSMYYIDKLKELQQCYEFVYNLKNKFTQDNYIQPEYQILNDIQFILNNFIKDIPTGKIKFLVQHCLELNSEIFKIWDNCNYYRLLHDDFNKNKRFLSKYYIF